MSKSSDQLTNGCSALPHKELQYYILPVTGMLATAKWDPNTCCAML